MIAQLNQETRNIGLKINHNKTKTMTNYNEATIIGMENGKM